MTTEVLIDRASLRRLVELARESVVHSATDPYCEDQKVSVCDECGVVEGHHVSCPIEVAVHALLKERKQAPVPVSVLLDVAHALKRARHELPYPVPNEGTLWADLNRASALVETYLLAPVLKMTITLDTETLMSGNA